MTPSPALRLHEVTADRPTRPAPLRVLDRVSLTVTPGELVAVMGPSGSGKTSLLHVACGLLVPTEGTVEVDGALVDPTDRHAWTHRRRRTVGIVHQRLDLLPGLSVLDNVALPLLLDRRPVKEAHQRARHRLERVGLAHLAGRSTTELSGGERQRVAIARAVAGPRHLLLADEPTAALDTAAAEGVVELLAELASTGTAVLMATHDSRLASWADRVVSLRDGYVVDAVPAAGTPA